MYIKELSHTKESIFGVDVSACLTTCKPVQKFHVCMIKQKKKSNYQLAL